MAENVMRKDLGPVSAYAIAKEHGYTGTEEAFAREIAEASMNARTAAEKAAEAASGADNAAGHASAAEGYASDAEAFGAGTRSGEPVESGDPAYEHNAGYFCALAKAAKDTAVSAAQTAAAAYGTDLLAPDYAELAFPVSRGQHCIRDGGYYEANADIPAAEPWNDSHWTRLSVGEEFGAVKSAADTNLNNQAIALYKRHSIQTSGQTGTVIDYSSPSVSSAGLNCAVIDCLPGDRFTLFGEGGSSARLWAFIDDGDKLISNSPAGATSNGLVITAPVNAAKCIVNTKGQAFRGVTVDVRLKETEGNVKTIADSIRNYFVDPLFSIFAAGPVHGSPALTFDSFIYRELAATNGFTYSSGKIVKPAGTSGNYVYSCTVEYDESIFGGNVSAAAEITDYDTEQDRNIQLYIRFMNADKGKISEAYAYTTKTGIVSRSATVPAGTKYVKVWLQSASAGMWAFKNPVLSDANAELMTCRDDLWRIVMGNGSNGGAGIAVVTDEAGFLSALDAKKVIYIASDFPITGDLNITRDVEIDGLGHTLTADGIASYMMNITNAKVTIRNAELVGDAEVDYVLIPNTGSDVLLDHCRIHTSCDTVVRCPNTAKVVIRNCDIGYSYRNDGVAPAGTAEVRIYDSVIHDCYDEGVSSHNSSYTECHNCEFYNCGYEVGTKTKGAESSFGGCHIGGGRMGIVEGCYSHDNCTYGIGLINFQMDLDNEIEKCFNNVVQNNGSHGIMCTYCRRLTLVNNSCIANAGDAIHFGRDPTHETPIGIPSSGYVADNIMYLNGFNGVVVDQDAESSSLHVQSDLHNAFDAMSIEELLLRDSLPGTSTTVTFDSSNNPVSIVHSADGATVRTDTFVWGETMVTETRTASNFHITIATNLLMLDQTISEIQAVG